MRCNKAGGEAEVDKCNKSLLKIFMAVTLGVSCAGADGTNTGVSITVNIVSLHNCVIGM